MRFEATAVAGAFAVHLDVHVDARGSFARSFCAAEFAAAGIAFQAVQLNLSRNPAAHTLRGMHLQADPHGEAKLVHCVHGRVFDVAIDLRLASPTRGAHAGLELTPDVAFYIPEGCAHGFLTLEDDCDVLYAMGTAFVPGVARGVRFDDPAFGIAWPAPPRIISDRDAAWPDYAP